MITPIPRFLKSEIQSKLEPQKVVVLYGPRQAGKTTLIKSILDDLKEDHLFVSGEDIQVRPWLGSQSIETLRQYIGDKKLLVIDEAQKVEQIGLNLKLIVDHVEGIKVLATGSSSFALSHQIGEPLVGRKWQFVLYPISQLELQPMETLQQTQEQLPGRMIFGSYPDVVTSSGIARKKEVLFSIVDHYLFKDLLEFDEVRKSQKLVDLLKLVAFQIGRDVSINELATQLKMNVRTVEKYLDLLEQSFVIKRVYGFSRNLRKEITKSSRFYFLDNGIRNALINNFNSFDSRDDVGELWENYIFIERLKRQSYLKTHPNIHFWRTHDQKEIDYVEEYGGGLHGYEFKWGQASAKPPSLWLKTYPQASFEVIHPGYYLDFIAKIK